MTDDIRYMAYATTIDGTVCSPDAGDAARRLRASIGRHGERRNPAGAANCMHADRSWRRPGQDYLDIYSRVQYR
jgi:hypothetical protein